jgi:hypothetical protein
MEGTNLQREDAWSHGTWNLFECPSFVLGINVQLASHVSGHYPTPIPSRPGHYPPTLVTHLSLQITRFWLFFSRVLGAVCVRPTSCNQKPPRRLSSANASAPSSGHVWTLICTSLPSFMQRDILPWIQRITTPAIYMPRRCFELGRLTQRCISSIFHLKCGVVDAWILKPSVVRHWEGTGKHERRWNSAYRTQVTHLRVCSSMMLHSSLHRSMHIQSSFNGLKECKGLS